MQIVTEVGAICDVDPRGDNDGHSQSFAVSEYLKLSDGTRVILHSERGFTVGSAENVRAGLSRQVLEKDVLNVVLPDEDNPTEAHPWDWLTELARRQGITVTPEQLKEVPYRVIIAEPLERWLSLT